MISAIDGQFEQSLLEKSMNIEELLLKTINKADSPKELISVENSIEIN